MLFCSNRESSPPCCFYSHFPSSLKSHSAELLPTPFHPNLALTTPELRTYLLLLSPCHLTSGRAFFLCLSCHSLPGLLPLLSLTRPGSSEVITWPFLLPTLHSLLPLTSAITWCRLHYSQWGMSTPTSPLSSKSKCPSSSWSSVVVGQV